MAKEARSDDGNRRGCLILTVIVVLALALIAWLGFSADPRNEGAEIIPAQPDR